MDLGLKDKGILVVGGTSGMGLATARELAREGARVVIVGRDASRTEKVAHEIDRERVSGLAADVSREGDVEGLIEASLEALGQLDGVAVMTGVRGHDPIEIPDSQWIETFEDVMLGTVRVVRSALPHMKNRGGSIVTTAAYSIRAPEIARLPYASLKASVAVFTKGIAKAYGADGIRANCICPGAIETEPLHALRGQIAEQRGWAYDEALERMMTEEWGLEVALGRPGRPEEVAELVTFLLSERAGYLTGSLLNIDGGTDF